MNYRKQQPFEPESTAVVWQHRFCVNPDIAAFITENEKGQQEKSVLEHRVLTGRQKQDVDFDECSKSRRSHLTASE
jgi:hypothetical protein